LRKMSEGELVRPKEWLRKQKSQLVMASEAEADWKRNGRDAKELGVEQARRAFKPIARYLNELAEGGVQLESESWPADFDKKAKATLQASQEGATEHRVSFSGSVKEMSGEIKKVEWGFGVRAVASPWGKMLRMRFEVFNFGVAGQVRREGSPSQVFEGAEEALKAYLVKIEDHTVAIESVDL
jgi:hypothetical protein